MRSNVQLQTIAYNQYVLAKKVEVNYMDQILPKIPCWDLDLGKQV